MLFSSVLLLRILREWDTCWAASVSKPVILSDTHLNRFCCIFVMYAAMKNVQIKFGWWPQLLFVENFSCNGEKCAKRREEIGSVKTIWGSGTDLLNKNIFSTGNLQGLVKEEWNTSEKVCRLELYLCHHLHICVAHHSKRFVAWEMFHVLSF